MQFTATAVHSKPSPNIGRLPVPLVIGIDIGTFEAKGVVTDANGGIVAKATRAHQVSTPEPGFVEHDAEDVWWGGLVFLVQELLNAEGVRSGDVVAICCSGIGPCVLPIDEEGSPLRPAILYGVDTRAGSQIDALNASLGEAAIRERCGNRLSSQSAGPKIAWIRDNEPDIHSAARRFVTCQSYLVGKLTDSWTIDHATAGYYHPLYELSTGQWNLAGCESFVRPDQLPRLAWANEIAGYVTAGASEATGLSVGTAVLVGTADAPAEALSAGVMASGEMMLMYGSSHFFIGILDRPVVHDTLYSAPYLFADSFVLAGGTATAGTITRWFVELLGLQQSVDGEVFAQLAEEAAASPPGARGIMALPHFSGERTPLDDPFATGAILGLTLAHSRGDLVRALFEGIAHGVRSVLDEYSAVDALPHVIRAVGGGTKNAVWTTAISDISGRPQDVIAGSGASYGDAMLAALALGLVPARESLRSWVKEGTRVEPRPELAGFYDNRHDLWVGFQSAANNTSRALQALRAPNNEGIV